MMQKLTTIFREAINSPRFWWLFGGFTILVRIPTLLFPYDSDHWIFQYVGKHWLAGDTLYVDAWDHKSPLIFLINGLMQKILGDSLILHRVFLSLVYAVTLFVFYKASMKVYEYLGVNNTQIRARISLIVFAFFTSLSQLTNSGNNTENFAILLIALLYLLYVSHAKRLSFFSWQTYVIGVVIGLIVGLKANFLLLLIPIGLDLALKHFRSINKLMVMFLIVASGILTVVAPFYVYFKSQGTLNELYVASFEFNSKYLQSGWAGNLSGQLIFIVILLITFIVFAPTIYRAFRSKQPMQHAIAASTLLFMVALGTFYSHYYLVLMPGLSVLFGIHYQWYSARRVRLYFAVVCVILASVISFRQLYNSISGEAKKQFDKDIAAANYIKENSDQSDKIFYYGYGATFYRLSDRDSGSRYVSASHLLIDWREGFGYDFNGLFMRDMELNKTRYVIIPDVTRDLYDDNAPVMQYFDNHYKITKALPGYAIYERTN